MYILEKIKVKNSYKDIFFFKIIIEINWCFIDIDIIVY